MDLSTAGIDRIDASYAGADNAGRPSRLDVLPGQASVPHRVEGGDTAVFGSFRHRQTEVLRKGGALELGIETGYRARDAALQAQGFPLRHGANAAGSVLQCPHDLGVVMAEAGNEPHPGDRDASWRTGR